MEQIEEDLYDDSMTDAEFFELMGVKYVGEASQKYPLETKKVLPQNRVSQPSNTAFTTWLPITSLVTLVILLSI